MKLTRILVVLSVLLLAASCKIRIISPVSGDVTTSSGAYSCSAGETCDIDVVDFFFDEVFVAAAVRGYTFRFWKKGDHRFCGWEKGPCQLHTTGLDTNQELLPVMTSFFENDEVFYLQPVFEEMGWFVETAPDLVTAIHVAADESLVFNDNKKPEIALRCRDGSFDVLINWRDLIDAIGTWDNSDHYIRIIDEEGGEKFVKFISSTNHTASFAPWNFQDMIVDALRENSEVTFEIYNWEANRVSAVFHSKGFEAAYQQVAQACDL